MLLSPGRATPPQLGGAIWEAGGSQRLSQPRGLLGGRRFPHSPQPVPKKPPRPAPGLSPSKPRCLSPSTAPEGGGSGGEPSAPARPRRRHLAAPTHLAPVPSERAHPAPPPRCSRPPDEPRPAAGPRLASPQRARRWRRRRVRSWAAAWPPGG